jgi:hypothetical protein
MFSGRVHTYVLMTKQFHLIVQTPKANLSEFMRQLYGILRRGLKQRVLLR